VSEKGQHEITKLLQLIRS